MKDRCGNCQYWEQDESVRSLKRMRHTKKSEQVGLCQLRRRRGESITSCAFGAGGCCAEFESKESVMTRREQAKEAVRWRLEHLKSTAALIDNKDAVLLIVALMDTTKVANPTLPEFANLKAYRKHARAERESIVGEILEDLQKNPPPRVGDKKQGPHS